MDQYNYIIFADLDGTVLDKRTFQPGRSLRTLELCRNRQVPIVFVSAKTRAEMEEIRRDLNNSSPFVCENGGGLFLPADQAEKPDGFEKWEGYWRRSSVTSIDELRQALKTAAETVDARIKGFGDMNPEEIASLTGLSLSRARLAKMREYDEPFIIEKETPEYRGKLIRAISQLGYRYTHGGTFHHITGNFDKGEALQLLKNFYLRRKPDVRFIGLGDSANDLPMLQLVDHPFLVKKPDGSHESGLGIEGIRLTDGIGPEGFAEAIESMLL